MTKNLWQKERRTIFKSLLKLSGGKQYKIKKNIEKQEEEILGI